MLRDAIVYLHSFREECQSRDQFEDLSISLRLLGELMREKRPGPDPFGWAVFLVTGCAPDKYLKPRAERAAFRQKELLDSIPDYDPAEAKQVERARHKRLSMREEMAENTLNSREE